MRGNTLLGLVTGILIAAAPPEGDANQKDLEKMQGDWAAVSIVRDGTKLSDDEAQSLFRTVKGNEYTVFLFSKPVGKGTFTIDARKNPKQIDARPAGAKPLLGIYTLEGERWKMCFAPPGKVRPADFSAKEGSEHTLIVWEREKK